MDLEAKRRKRGEKQEKEPALPDVPFAYFVASPTEQIRRVSAKECNGPPSGLKQSESTSQPRKCCFGFSANSEGLCLSEIPLFLLQTAKWTVKIAEKVKHSFGLVVFN